MIQKLPDSNESLQSHESLSRKHSMRFSDFPSRPDRKVCGSMKNDHKNPILPLCEQTTDSLGATNLEKIISNRIKISRSENPSISSKRSIKKESSMP